MKRIPLNFSVGFADKEFETPKKMYAATVPGAVQLDYQKGENLGDYYYGENVNDYRFLEDKWVQYRATLPEFTDKTELCCGGIDYCYKVRVDDTVIYEYEGLYKPFRLDVTSFGGKTLYIDIAPVPKIEGVPESRAQAALCTKPPVGYGWDWHPRLIPSGIWEDIYLEQADSFIEDFSVDYTLYDECDSLDIKINLTLSTNADYEISVINPQGAEIMSFNGCGNAEIKETLYSPQLWWPNGYGKQLLYTFKARLKADKDIEKTLKIGFKTVELAMPEDSWQEPQNMPKSRSDAPTLMKINGKSIFLKGSNWVSPEIFYGTLTKERYEPLLKLACDAHFNILRVWGGGNIHKDSFYELCDELGILIWQEFPLSCNEYKNEPHYLSVLKSEGLEIIKRLKHHACLAIWCGGNELFNAWSKMTDQHKALRLLNSLCLEHTPDIPFLATSPLCGMAHGGYTFLDSVGGAEREVYEVIKTARNSAYTEFGVPALSPIKNIKATIPENEIFPVKPTPSWVIHHGFEAWQQPSWCELPTLEKYFGVPKSIEEMIENSNILQCEGLKAMFEGARRQWPRCTMALSWYYDEAWPTAAGEYLVSYFGEIRPAYYAVKDALRPVLASAEPERFSYLEGDIFEAKLWMLNDSFKAYAPTRVTAYLELCGKRLGEITWNTEKITAETNIEGPTLRVKLPKAAAGLMTLKVTSEIPDTESCYTFHYSPKEEKQESAIHALNQ